MQNSLFAVWLPTSRESFFRSSGPFEAYDPRKAYDPSGKEPGDKEPPGRDTIKTIRARKDYLNEGAANRLLTFLLNPLANSALEYEEDKAWVRSQFIRDVMQKPEFTIGHEAPVASKDEDPVKLVLNPSHPIFPSLRSLSTRNYANTTKKISRDDPLECEYEVYDFKWPKDPAERELLAQFSQVFKEWQVQKRPKADDSYVLIHIDDRRREAFQRIPIVIESEMNPVHANTPPSASTDRVTPTSHITLKLLHNATPHLGTNKNAGRAPKHNSREHERRKSLLKDMFTDIERAQFCTDEGAHPIVPFELTCDEYGFYYFDFSEARRKRDAKDHGRLELRAKYIMVRLLGSNFICHSMNPDHDYTQDKDAQSLIETFQSTRGYQGILSHDQLLLIVEGVMNYNLNTKVFYGIGIDTGEDSKEIIKRYSLNRFIEDITVSLPHGGIGANLKIPSIDFAHIDLGALYSRKYRVSYVKDLLEDEKRTKRGVQQAFGLPLYEGALEDLERQIKRLAEGKYFDFDQERVDRVRQFVTSDDKSDTSHDERGRPSRSVFDDICHVFIQDKIEELALRRYIRATLDRPYLAEIENSVYVTRKRLTNRIIKESSEKRVDQISFESDNVDYFYNATNLANFIELLIAKIPILTKVNDIMRDAYYIKLGNLTSVTRMEEEEEIDHLAAYRPWLQKVTNIVDNTQLLATNLDIFTASRNHDVNEEMLRAQTDRWDQEHISKASKRTKATFDVPPRTRHLVAVLALVISGARIAYDMLYKFFGAVIEPCWRLCGGGGGGQAVGGRLAVRLDESGPAVDDVTAGASVAHTWLDAVCSMAAAFFAIPVAFVCSLFILYIVFETNWDARRWRWIHRPLAWINRLLSKKEGEEEEEEEEEEEDFWTLEYRRRAVPIAKLRHDPENVMTDINLLSEKLIEKVRKKLGMEPELIKSATRVSQDRELCHFLLRAVQEGSNNKKSRDRVNANTFCEDYYEKVRQVLAGCRGSNHSVDAFLQDRDAFRSVPSEQLAVVKEMCRACLKDCTDLNTLNARRALEELGQKLKQLELDLVLVYSFELRPQSMDDFSILLDSAKVYYRIKKRKEFEDLLGVVEAALHPSFCLLAKNLFKANEATSPQHGEESLL